MPSPEPAGNFTVGSLSVGRTARLGGTLTVEKTAGLKVEAGATAEVITAPAVSGRFNLVRGIKGPGPALTLAYGPASVTLAAPQH
jgi:hypothetical protein